MLNGQIISDKELSGKLVKNEELFNHEYLYNRNAANAHPIQAITGLKEKLIELENKAPNEFKLIKAEIFRLLANILAESTRAQSSEKQIQAEVDKLTKVLTTIQNDEEIKKLVVAVAELEAKNLKLKNELDEAINKVSEDLLDQVSLVKDLSNTANTNVTDLIAANRDLKELSEKFSSIEASISTCTNTIADIEEEVDAQKATLDELEAKLKELNSSAPETSVTTEDITSIEENITNLTSRVNAVESSVNDEDGILSKLTELDDIAGTLKEAIQTLNTKTDSSNTKIAANEDSIKTYNKMLQSIQSIISTNTTKISSVKSKIDSLKTTVEALTEDVGENSTKVDKLEDDLNTKFSGLESKIDETEEDLEARIQDKIKLLNTAIQTNAGYINDLEEAKDAAQDDILELQIDVYNIKGSTDTLKQAVKDLSKVTDKLNNEEEGKYHAACSYIDNQLAEITKELDAALKTHSNQQEAIEGIDSKVQNLVTSKESFEASITELTNITNGHSTDIGSLKSTTDTLVQKTNSFTHEFASEYNKNLAQDERLAELETKLTELFEADENLGENIGDLQDQISSMSSVLRLVGVIDTTTTVTDENGKPKHLVSKPNSGNAKVTLKNSIYNSISNAYEAQPGDIVLVEIFNTNNESLGYAEFIYTNQDWEELVNIHSLENQLRHTLQVAINDHTDRINTMKAEVDRLEDNIAHHIANDFVTRSLIFSSKENAELYAQGMDPDRFPIPEGTPPAEGEYLRTNAYPGLIITVATDDIYESYIIKEDRSLTLISGGGGGSGSPDKETDYQYCFRTSAELDTSFVAVDEGGYVKSYAAVNIGRPTRKNNTLLIDASSTAGGDYIYYLSTLPNLKFTCNGFEATFRDLGQLEHVLNDVHYTLYRSNRKITEAIELVVN